LRIRLLIRSSFFPYTTLFRSYWMPIEPFKQNIHFANAQIAAGTDGNFIGKVNQASYGYIGLEKRSAIEEKNLEEYIKTAENDKADRKSTRLNSSHVKISYAVF